MNYGHLFLLGMFAGPSCATPQNPIPPVPWEHEQSDLAPDPRVHYGALDNGLRFAWASHPEPQHRAWLRLHVDVGSLAEEEGERGVAHFLEHMAFNGSENFPAGELIPWFQEHGMAFGADSNAHTSFSETVYQLDLPQADAASLQEGLTVLSDFAGRLLLEGDEIEAEKGVVDAEDRERDSASMRVMLEDLARRFGGTRYAERLPIGTKEDRDSFTAESVRRFWKRWYRPDRMTLVLVGDLGDLDPTSLIQNAFADLTNPPTPPSEEPAIGQPQQWQHDFALMEEEVPFVTITLEKILPWQDRAFNRTRLTNQVPLDYANRMLNQRLTEMVKKEDTPFVSASVSWGPSLKAFEGPSLRISCEPARWQEALAAAEQELRRALTHGFLDEELMEARARGLRRLREAVARQPKASSLGLAESLVAAAENRFIPISANLRLEILEPEVSALTPQDCLASLQSKWKPGEWSLHLFGNVDLGENSEEQLAAALARSRDQVVAPFARASAGKFAYSAVGEAAPILETIRNEEFDFSSVLFANSVRVHLKPTDFRENQVLVHCELGEGRLSLDNQKTPLSWVADQVFASGGLEEHSIEDLQRLLAGRLANFGFSVGDDRFLLEGTTSGEDLQLQCELLCAAIAHPGFREEGLVPLHRMIPQVFANLRTQLGGPMGLEFMPALWREDPRVGLPAQEDLLAITMADIRAWLGPLLSEAPLEVTIVGDFGLEEAKEIVAKTFGKLSKRRPLKEWPERLQWPECATDLHMVRTIETRIPKSLVVVAWPMPDGKDATRATALQVLESVVSDRLRERLREELGATYSPATQGAFSSVYPGRGVLFAQAFAEPGRAQEVLDSTLRVMNDFAEEGASQEEIQRALEPLRKRLRDAQRMNGFWVSVLSESVRNPESLVDLREAENRLNAIQPDSLAPFLPLLRENLAATLLVHPQTESDE